MGEITRESIPHKLRLRRGASSGFTVESIPLASFTASGGSICLSVKSADGLSGPPQADKQSATAMNERTNNPFVLRAEHNRGFILYTSITVPEDPDCGGFYTHNYSE